MLMFILVYDSIGFVKRRVAIEKLTNQIKSSRLTKKTSYFALTYSFFYYLCNCIRP